MATRKINYDSEKSITITLAPSGVGLAQAAARECTAIDNSTDLYVDVILELMLKVGSGTIGSDKVINVWFYASEDGTNYTDNATGSDAAVTMASPPNLLGPWVINVPTQSLTYKAIIPSVARIFGGTMPYKWGIVIENRCNISFSTTEGDHTHKYKGVYETVN